MDWKEKHKILLENKKGIIKKYNENIPIKEIAKIYKVSYSCIRNNLRLWGIRKNSGIRYLLAKCIKDI